MNTFGLRVYGFTGTSRGLTRNQRRSLKQYIYDQGIFYAAHGDCVGGDEVYHDLCDMFGTYIYIHPPINPNKRAFCVPFAGEWEEEKEYLDRNKDIVNRADLMIACPGEFAEQLRSGTWSTVRYAEKQQKKCWLIYPDGTALWSTDAKERL